MTHQEISKNKQTAALSIKKANGIITSVLKMIEEDKYCPEIIQQIEAAKGLLDSSKKTLLIGHLDHCLESKMKEDKTKAIKELIKIFDLK